MSRIRANTITNQNANGAPNFPNGVTVSGVVTATATTQNISGNLTVSGNLGVGGVLTYEDVTNVDAVGIVTARSGIKIGPTAGVAGTFFADGSYRTSGIITATTFHGSGANLTGIVGVPSGCILIWSGAANAIPTGFVLCNGSNSTPDLRGKFVVGYHDSNGDYDVGDTGGAETVTLTTNEMPAHSHSTRWWPVGSAYNLSYPGLPGHSGGNVSSSGHGTNQSGGGAAHENRPPYYALCFIMKT